MELEEALRLSGEETARQAERLRTSDSGRRNDEGAALLKAAAVHMKYLQAASMGMEALATGIMTVLAILHNRVNPEKIAEVYTAFLQDVYILSLNLCREGSPDEMVAGHLMEISMRLGALAAVTGREFGADTAAMPGLAERHIAICAMFDGAPADFWQFQDAPVTPRSAIDIFSDAAARLSSLGLIGPENE